MALTDNNSVDRSENQNLSRFVDNLTLEAQRTLSRLINSWENAKK
jgi:hypothetical protein